VGLTGTNPDGFCGIFTTTGRPIRKPSSPSEFPHVMPPRATPLLPGGYPIMNRARELRQRVERYRQLKTQVTDPAAIRAISELAEEAVMTAEEMERRQRIRGRAHEIWIERGCPEGRDVEFWLEAEGELETQRRRRV
jgi:hypothetical protein